MVDRGSFKQQEIVFLDDERITIHANVESTTLPKSFQPDNWSVIIGRGKECYDHVGNRRLRVLVDANLDRYSACKSKFEKTLVVSSIIDTVRESSTTAGFVKQDPVTKDWTECGDAAAREKIGQLLREAMIKRDPNKLKDRNERRKAKAKVRAIRQGSKSLFSDNSSATLETSSTTANSSTTRSVAPETPSTIESLSTTQAESCKKLTTDDYFDLEPLPLETNPRLFVFSFHDLQF